ncbi:acyl-CoA thioesterase [Shinella sp. NM-101]|uniref:acyl-CoA thioesterase n=1 Tax=Shinella sp. NM-101 TaxID=2744455 RepID=UPI001F3EDF27
MALVEHVVDVSFGDCDPAGIVFYPNYFRWMDATFHRFLSERAGGHTRLCGQLGAKGIGLMEATLSFRLPVTEGERIIFRAAGIDWGGRSMTVRYEVDFDGKRVLEGRETRGVFVLREGRMVAVDVRDLQLALAL